MSDKPTPSPSAFDKAARFLMHYGDFLAFWSTFDMVVELIVMRELGLDEEKNSIVCASLGFGAKMHIACSLLNRRPGTGTQRSVALLKEAQTLAERNNFAHGFFLMSRSSQKFELVRREVKDRYHVRSRSLDSEAMSKHLTAFIAKVDEIRKHLGISANDLAEYGTAIQDHASALPSQGKHHPGSLTSSKKANQKSGSRPRLPKAGQGS